MKKNIRHIVHIILIGCIYSTGFSQLVISPGSSITIKNGTSLYAGTNLYIKSDATGSGHLADQNTGGNTSITGDVTIERYISAESWHNVSAPVNNAHSSLYGPADLIFYYDETIILNDWNFGWIWYEGDLMVMRGYDVYSPTSITTNYYTSESSNLNTGSYTIGVTLTNVPNGETENHKGWNLIGNPYPSPINWLEESGWNKTSINDAKYIWDHSNNNYTIYLGGASPVGINGGTQYIPSNQGFWVQAITNGNVSVNNSARVGVSNGTPDYYKSSDNHQVLRLITSGNNYSDESIIRFIPGTTSGFDVNYDALKLLSTNDSVPQIFSFSENKRFAINTYPEVNITEEVELYFQCNSSGYYSISLSENSTVNHSNKIYLKDKVNQTIQNLIRNPEYTFYHNKSNIKNRFTIYTNPSDDILNNITPQNYFSVYAHKNKISLVKNTTKDLTGNIHIYNITGQIIMTRSLSNTSVNSFNLGVSDGYYIVSIRTNEYVINHKIRVSH